ncbi:MAG: hypothetical protein JO021_19535, partial [Alphaproteobacteria bacterium]|nr:hypothetical protein [Alphaproteobacteria bacterium]
MPSFPPRWASLLGLLSVLALLPSVAVAQTVDPAYKADYDAAFRATYDRPSDVEAALTFAKIATLAGDAEAAIGALERVLIFNPDLPEVDLALGELYRSLGSFAMAKVYLDRADAARLSPEDRAKRERLLAEVSGAQSRHRLNASFTSGLRYQTNANAGANAAARIAGASLDFNTIKPKADTNAFATLFATHSVDLGDQDGTSWDTRTLLYGTRQFQRHLINVALIDAATGPRFRLDGNRAGSPTLQPFIVGNVFELGGSEYFSSAGGGLNSTVRLAPDLGLDLTFDARNVSFNNTAHISTANYRDAQQVQGRMLVLYTPTENDLITGLVQPTNYDARKAWETFNELVLSGSYVHRFPAPWTLSELPWSVSVTAGKVWRFYAGRDATVDANTLRQDDEYDIGGSLVIGLANQVDFRLDVQQVWSDSTVA